MTEQEYQARQEQRRVLMNEKRKLQLLSVCYREAYAEAKAAGASDEDAGEFALSSRLLLKAKLQEQS